MSDFISSEREAERFKEEEVKDNIEKKRPIKRDAQNSKREIDLARQRKKERERERLTTRLKQKKDEEEIRRGLIRKLKQEHVSVH